MSDIGSMLPPFEHFRSTSLANGTLPPSLTKHTPIRITLSQLPWDTMLLLRIGYFYPMKRRISTTKKKTITNTVP
jgi:hypothetical protein